MSKIEKVLKEWEDDKCYEYLSDPVIPAVNDMVADIREALKGCSVLEWHPVKEEPERTADYLVVTISGYVTRGAYIADHWWGTPEPVKEWAEIPKRGGE